MTQITDVLIAPGPSCESEYRAIYDFLKDAWQDMGDEPDDEKFAHMVAILIEFQNHAENLRRRVKAAWRKQRLS